MKKFLRRFSTTAAPPSVFGSHLDVLVAKDRAAGRTSGDPNVPYIMKKFVKCLSTEEALKTEGLFRVSGSAKLSKDLREKIDKTGTIDLHDVEAHDIPAVASVFKQWLRELPEALVPDTFYAAVEDAAGSVDDLRTVLLTLPPLNFATLSYLCRFIHKISTYSHDNRMPTANLSVVFAPNVFKCPSEPRPGASSTMAGVPQTPVASGDQTGYFAESLVVSKIMTFLLDHVREVFGADDVPDFIDTDPDPPPPTKSEKPSTKRRSSDATAILRTAEASDLARPQSPPVEPHIRSASNSARDLMVQGEESKIPVAEQLLGDLEGAASAIPAEMQPAQQRGRLGSLGGSFFAIGRKRGATVTETSNPTSQPSLLNPALTKLKHRQRSSSNPPVPATTSSLQNFHNLPTSNNTSTSNTSTPNTSTPNIPTTNMTPAPIVKRERRKSLVDELKHRFAKPKAETGQHLQLQAQTQTNTSAIETAAEMHSDSESEQSSIPANVGLELSTGSEYESESGSEEEDEEEPEESDEDQHQDDDKQSQDDARDADHNETDTESGASAGSVEHRKLEDVGPVTTNHQRPPFKHRSHTDRHPPVGRDDFDSESAESEDDEVDHDENTDEEEIENRALIMGGKRQQHVPPEKHTGTAQKSDESTHKRLLKHSPVETSASSSENEEDGAHATTQSKPVPTPTSTTAPSKSLSKPPPPAIPTFPSSSETDSAHHHRTHATKLRPASATSASSYDHLAATSPSFSTRARSASTPIRPPHPTPTTTCTQPTPSSSHSNSHSDSHSHRPRITPLRQQDRRKSVSFQMPDSADELGEDENETGSVDSSATDEGSETEEDEESGSYSEIQKRSATEQASRRRQQQQYNDDSHNDTISFSHSRPNTTTKPRTHHHPHTTLAPSSPTTKAAPTRPAPLPPPLTTASPQSRSPLSAPQPSASSSPLRNRDRVDSPRPSTTAQRPTTLLRAVMTKTAGGGVQNETSSTSVDTNTTTTTSYTTSNSTASTATSEDEESPSESSWTGSEDPRHHHPQYHSAAKVKHHEVGQRIGGGHTHHQQQQQQHLALSAREAVLKRRNSEMNVGSKLSGDSSLGNHLTRPASSSNPLLTTSPDQRPPVSATHDSSATYHEAERQRRAEHARKRAQTLGGAGRPRGADADGEPNLHVQSGALWRSDHAMRESEEAAASASPAQTRPPQAQTGSAGNISHPGWSTTNGRAGRPQSALPLTSHNKPTPHHHPTSGTSPSSPAPPLSPPSLTLIATPPSLPHIRAELLALYAQIKEIKQAAAAKAHDDADRASDVVVLRGLVARYRTVKSIVKASSATPSSTPPLTLVALTRLAQSRHAAHRPYALTAMTPAHLAAERKDLKAELVALKHEFARQRGENANSNQSRVDTNSDEKSVVKALYARYTAICALLSSHNTNNEHVTSPTTPLTPLTPPPYAHPDDTTADLVAEKKRVQAHLRHFQLEFEHTHGRPVRSGPDRAPVADAYRRYKELRMILGSSSHPAP